MLPFAASSRCLSAMYFLILSVVMSIARSRPKRAFRCLIESFSERIDRNLLIS